jgi:acyl-homoserine-lactone acylase
MNDPVRALTQSYTRTKARNLREFRATMDLRTNSSNNTLFADAEGNIAYFHANYIPRRDTTFDWSKPVDGSNPATEWQGLHEVDEAPNVINPSIGWVYNTNNWPFSAAGPDSPSATDYPLYMDDRRENARGLHAIRVLEGRSDFTLESLIAAAYDSYLTAFEVLVPRLLAAYDSVPASPLQQRLAEPVGLLRGWDLRWSTGSEATTLAVAWGTVADRLTEREARAAGIGAEAYLATRATAAELVQALDSAVKKLTADYGRWRIPWGEVNRFQRLTGAIVHRFSDSAPSIPVGFTSARWGSLASFGARQQRGTKKLYGTSGNSFVAVVEFGDRVRARAVTAGGESGDPASPHFNDQALRYSTGDLREVYFYPEQLTGHTERRYRPGER